MSELCELPDSNPPEPEIANLLREANTIVVYGMSRNPGKASNQVALYLRDAGYEMIPVNPTCDRIGDLVCYRSLEAIPAEKEIDVLDIFRPPAEIPGIVDAGLERGVKAVWMQEGIAHNEAAAKARAAGLFVVMSRCIMKEHRKLSA